MFKGKRILRMIVFLIPVGVVLGLIQGPMQRWLGVSEHVGRFIVIGLFIIAIVLYQHLFEEARD